MKNLIFLLLLTISLNSFGQGTPIVHTQMPAAGYEFKYVKADSGLVIAFRDTTTGRGTTRPGAMVVRPQDSLFWGFNGHHWERFGKVSNVIPKVDSVTVSGDTLFYWINGYSVGAILPNGNNWKFTGNYGICDGCFIGTLDAADLVFRVDNTEAGRLSNFGKTQLGFLAEAFWREAAAFGYMALAKNPSSTAIGPRAEAAADSSTAIGAGASINVNQGVGLGDTNRALVGIRTGFPEYPLDVKGQVRIKDGTEGAGKVLTSDATGAASWTTVTGTGTVTNLATGYGLSGGAITTTGTIIVDTATLSGKYLRVGDTTYMLSYYLRKGDTTNKWVRKIENNAGADSIVYWIGSTRYAIKDNGTGVGGGTPITNTGSFYRFVVPSSQAVKTLANNWGALIDSTTNSGSLTIWVDSSVVASKGYALSLYDLLNAGKQNISDTSTVDATRYWVNSQAFLTAIDLSIQKAFDGGNQLNKGDTIKTHAASENGLSIEVFRPVSDNYNARSFSRYGFNVYNRANAFTLIQDGQIEMKNPYPFQEMHDTLGILRHSVGWDAAYKHSYLDMDGSTDYTAEYDGSNPWLYVVGPSSGLFPSRYWGNIVFAGLPSYNVIIGNGLFGDPSAAHDKDSKLTVYGNLKVQGDTFKLKGKMFANSLQTGKYIKQLYWNPADSMVYTGDSTGIGSSYNIYQSNGTLTGNRVVNGAGYDMAMTGFSLFDINTQSSPNASALNMTGVYTQIAADRVGTSSYVRSYADSVELSPSSGNLFIKNLTHYSVNGTNKMLVWDSSSNKVRTMAIPSGGGGSSRMAISTHSVGTDANITAAAGYIYALPDATLSTNRTIDVTAINTNGDYFEIDNLETGFTWSFTGATVYLIDGTTTVTNLSVGFYQFRRINGKIKQIN